MTAALTELFALALGPAAARVRGVRVLTQLSAAVVDLTARLPSTVVDLTAVPRLSSD